MSTIRAMSEANSTCDLPPNFWNITSIAQYIGYDIIPPINICLGLFGHVLFLIIFLRQWKHESAFGYQVYCALSELINVIGLNAFIYTNFHWSGFWRTGVDWFTKSYVMMWWTAHLAIPVMHMAVTNALLASLSMAIERVLAMAVPLNYSGFNHKAHQLLAFFICSSVSITTSIFDGFRMKLENENGVYKMVFNLEFSNSTFANFSAQLRNAIRVLGVLALIVSNLVMVHFYKKRLQQVTHAGQNQQKDKARRNQEKTLLLLTIIQSILTVVKIFGEVALLTGIYALPWFISCGYLELVAPIIDSLIQIADILQFVATLTVSKHLRRMVVGLFRSVQTGH